MVNCDFLKEVWCPLWCTECFPFRNEIFTHCGQQTLRGQPLWHGHSWREPHPSRTCCVWRVATPNDWCGSINASSFIPIQHSPSSYLKPSLRLKCSSASVAAQSCFLSFLLQVLISRIFPENNLHANVSTSASCGATSLELHSYHE